MSILTRISPRATAGDFPSRDILNLFDTMRRDMSRGWDELPSALFRSNGISTSFVPDVDIVESDTEIKVSAELPGLSEKDLQISVTPDSLKLSGEKKTESKEEKAGYYHFERYQGSFMREIPLPAEVDINKVDAKLHNGVLKISLKKTAEARTQVRQIEVKAS